MIQFLEYNSLLKKFTNIIRKKRDNMGRTYVFSDIHGMLDLYKQIKAHLNTGNHKAIFLGDACDRGEHGYMIMKDILQNDNILYIKGNHEDMFVHAARAIMDILIEQNMSIFEWRNERGIQDLIYNAYYNDDVALHLNNGGFHTLYEWLADGASMTIVNTIDRLPTYLEFVNNNGDKITFCHAGTLNKEKDNIDSRIWSRDHFFEKWDDGILIHGHTPCQHLIKQLGRHGRSNMVCPVWYCDNTKIDMDTGCFSTNIIYLMDVDSKEMIKFSAE